MLFVDDVLFFPFKSILAVFQEIYKAAVEEIAAESGAIRAELSQIYLALEAGALSEEAFDARERELLDRLDAIEERGLIEEDEEGGNEDEDEETDEETDEWTTKAHKNRTRLHLPRGERDHRTHFGGLGNDRDLSGRSRNAGRSQIDGEKEKKEVSTLILMMKLRPPYLSMN